jgi:hypothetical protein
MSATERQNRLLVAEDWKRVYQSFRNADFQSYDFDSLRRVMINYLRENFPEDFNDYLDSSEYIALIDLIAFLGQSISYRIDLNSRDNFLELAERRESVLRLARLLSYNPHRNIAASGMLKFSSVATSQSIFDSNGRSLSGQTVSWNDAANPAWYDQFIRVLNAALPISQQFGAPSDRTVIQGIQTEQYRFQAISDTVPVFPFSKTVDGSKMDFEIVSTTFKNAAEVYEEPPAIGNKLAFIYRNDGKGNGSSNSGFFVNFKQGTLSQGTFVISHPSTNESVDIDTPGINNSDVWLYRLNQDGFESELWAQVPSLEGNNIIYNSLDKNIKNIYGVVTRVNDQASLVFSDGTFGTLPRGQFRAYYRVSNGMSFTINPKDIRNVAISIPYVSNVGQVETLTLTLSLMSAVSNSSESETDDNIKARAPATYYTQNRMITAEDYNISPLSVSQDVVKIKAINRSAAGISRGFDLIDPTGKYSSVNLFASDGALYEEIGLVTDRFSFTNTTSIESVITSQVIPRLNSVQLRDFFFDTVARKQILWYSWVNLSSDQNLSTGYVALTSALTASVAIGISTAGSLSAMAVRSMVKFVAPAGFYFDTLNNNRLVSVISPEVANFIPGAATELWTQVTVIENDGILIPRSESGPVSLSDNIPTGALLQQIIPVWKPNLTVDTIRLMTDLISSNKTFGLRYDAELSTWNIIPKEYIGYGEFSLLNAGRPNDSSWMMLFSSDNEFYTIKTRQVQYVFESDKQVRFYFNSADNRILSTTAGVADMVSVLSVNPRPESTIPFTRDVDWQIAKEYVGIDGYVDTKKIVVSLSDQDSDGAVDNPDAFAQVVADKVIVLERYEVFHGQEDYRIFNNANGTVVFFETESPAIAELLNTNTYTLGQYFYFADTKLVKKFTQAPTKLEITLDFKVFPGRDQLKFQYVHNASSDSRIDPGLTNIVDIFVLTKQYDKEYRRWLTGSVISEPLPPSTTALYSSLAPSLNKIKSISDEIIYHPVRYKLLFGSNAAASFQATFKIVKNPGTVISDNDIKAKTLSAITEFFSLENWDFGDCFYFSELSTFVMNRVAPYMVNFLIVPRQDSMLFGNLYEIKAEKDQIFISGATIDDIDIIQSITTSNIKGSSAISTSLTEIALQQQVTSSGNI